MKALARYRFFFLITLALSAAVFLLTRCSNNNNSGNKTATEKHTRGNTPADTALYAGSASCGKCHTDLYNKHLKTAHYLTSQEANEETIMGSFAEGKNVYTYTPLLNMLMHKTDSGLYQSVNYKGERKKDFRFDLVTGSGTKGQTYLYWQGNKLFQMPVSYFTAAGQWANSPGFPSDRVMFDKPISTRCLECHATYVSLLSEPDIKNEEFDHRNMILGVDCEKCHGGGAQHVTFHTAHPEEKKGKYIVSYASFTRQQQLDMCRLCHDGSIKKSSPSFSYRPGDNLADYFTVDSISAGSVSNDNVDVHGNQFGLLKASKCFTQSTMTCSSCHNVHENEKGNLLLYSQRCATCHTKQHKPIPDVTNEQITANCIDCHMPAKPSRTLTLYVSNEETPAVAYIRSHYVSIYPEEVKLFIERLKKNTPAGH